MAFCYTGDYTFNYTEVHKGYEQLSTEDVWLYYLRLNNKL